MGCDFYGKRTIDAESFSPYVALDLAGLLTVGNKSSPSFNNEAVIKSFDLGVSNGLTAEVEILDEQGGTFGASLNKMATNLCDNNAVVVKWGWVKSDCGSSTGSLLTAGPLYFQVKDVQITYEGGKIKYKMSLVDTMKLATATSRMNWSFGTDDQPMGLKDALTQMMQRDCPSINIEWYNKEGLPSDWNFKDTPKSVWDTDNQNKLATALKWMEYNVSDNDRGVYASWDATSKDPTIIFREAAGKDYETDPSGSKSETYIVNGGKNSNVISFVPSVNWAAWMEAAGRKGGNAGSAWTGQGTTIQSQQDKSLGKQTTLSPSRTALDTFGPVRAMSKAEFNQMKNAEADILSGLGPVNAELKIQGDPSPEFWHPIQSTGRQIKIVVINPFHLRGNNDWLAEPVCNPVFTSDKWLVTGASHSIREGSFTTTLKVMLNSPFGGTDLENLNWSVPNGK